MILLTRGRKLENTGTCLRIVKEQPSCIWNVYMSHWHQHDSKQFLKYKTTKEILMNRDDLLQFAGEIRRLLEEKPIERTELNLTLQSNKPQFKVVGRLMAKGKPMYFDDLKGMIELSTGFNMKYSVVKDDREEYRYFYEGKGLHRMMHFHYCTDELEKFADELEMEAKECKDDGKESLMHKFKKIFQKIHR